MRCVLGVQRLSAGEVVLIISILKLSSNLSAEWTVLETHECDVLLTDIAENRYFPQAPNAPAVIYLIPRADKDAYSGPGFLARPIYAEELIAALNSAAQQIARLAPPARSSRHGSTEQARMLRWPSRSVLARHPAYLQLATAMTAGAHSADSLARTTGTPLAACVVFLELLEVESALLWLGHQAQGRQPHLPAAPASATQPPGLLTRIRRRLGLQRPQEK